MNSNAKGYSLITITNAVFAALLSIIFVVIFRWGALGRFLSLFLVSFSVSIYVLKSMLTKMQFDKNHFVKALLFGWPISLSAMLSYFLNGVDRFILSKFDQTVNYALYSISLMILSFMNLLYTSLYQTFEPDLYKAISVDNRKKIFKIVRYN